MLSICHPQLLVSLVCQKVPVSIKGHAFRVLGTLCGGVDRPNPDVAAAVLDGLETVAVLRAPGATDPVTPGPAGRGGHGCVSPRTPTPPPHPPCLAPPASGGAPHYAYCVCAQRSQLSRAVCCAVG